jgi:hypothetical protein
MICSSLIIVYDLDISSIVIFELLNGFLLGFVEYH